MARTCLASVERAFNVVGHGVVVVIGMPKPDEPSWDVRIGDPIILEAPEGTIYHTTLRGHAYGYGQMPKDVIPLFLGVELTMKMVPVGTRLWVSDDDALSTTTPNERGGETDSRGARPNAASLSVLLQSLAEHKGRGARSWVGPVPAHAPSLLATVAANIELDARGRESEFVGLTTDDAAIWLTLFATQSLLHGGDRIPDGLPEKIASSLARLGPQARIFSKGQWQYSRHGDTYLPVRADNAWKRSRHHVHFSPVGDPLPPIGPLLTDGCIIGFDSETAFIFWVEDDD